ncbi:hypothetical protein CMUS01_11463 [Colletotrichum musicola]|uniref:Uncharacterized protein n=1 Tax=Colletotrichum musicola TaxID=2175873 RepID=A0A8H6JXG9_9PEZI|nr:hypothetical protein CMUS01_11463 [Colletotrichum musicola]
MLGHENGMMDYVWALSRGRLTLYPNDVPGGPEKPPHWGSPRVIFNPPENQGRSLDRRDLHLADWNGDGLCDVIYVKPDTGKVEVWINRLNKTSGDFNWRHLPDPAPTLSCNQKRGHGIFDLAAEPTTCEYYWEPLDHTFGNDRDVIHRCMEKDGRTTGFVHNDGGSWESVDQIKFSVGMMLTLVTDLIPPTLGDGKADFLWVEKFSGDTSVWLNQGRRDGKGADGSSFQWDQAGVLYRGAAQGSCYHFPDLDGNKLADFHLTYSDTNKADTSFNDCPDNGGEDDKSLTDPGLPIPPSDRWKNVRCTDKYVNDSATDAGRRWRAADGDGAWEAVVQYYCENKTTFPYFSQYVGRFFNTQDDRHCGLMGGGDNCNTIECNDEPHTAPASFLITDSLVQYHNIFKRLHEGLSYGSDKADKELSTLEGDFALGLSPLSSAARDNIRDLSVNAVLWGVTIAKDEYSKAELGGKLKDTLFYMTEKLQNTTVDLVSSHCGLFSLFRNIDLTSSQAERVFLGQKHTAENKDEELKNLYATISQGKMINATYAPTISTDIKNAVAKSLTVFMIGNAWRMGVQGHHPVLLTTDAKCDAPHEGDKDVFTKDLEASATCVDGRRYYLMSAGGKACLQVLANFECQWNKFERLPGVDKLGKANLYYGLTLNDFARGALNNFKRYGNRPTTEQLQIPDKETIRSFFDMEFGGAGSVPIEVCSKQEALDWWRNDENKMKSTREFACPEKV